MLKSVVVITTKEPLAELQRTQIEKDLKRRTDVDVLFATDLFNVQVVAPYTFEERKGDYSWKAGVRTMNDLVMIADECCGLANIYGS